MDVGDDTLPYNFFKIFFADDYWEDLAVQTNLYATQDLASATISPHSRKAKWKSVTIGELKVFFGSTIAKSLVREDDMEKFGALTKFLTHHFSGKSIYNHINVIRSTLSTYLQFIIFFCCVKPNRLYFMTVVQKICMMANAFSL